MMREASLRFSGFLDANEPVRLESDIALPQSGDEEMLCLCEVSVEGDEIEHALFCDVNGNGIADRNEVHAKGLPGTTTWDGHRLPLLRDRLPLLLMVRDDGFIDVRVKGLIVNEKEWSDLCA